MQIDKQTLGRAASVTLSLALLVVCGYGIFQLSELKRKKQPEDVFVKLLKVEADVADLRTQFATNERIEVLELRASVAELRISVNELKQRTEAMEEKSP